MASHAGEHKGHQAPFTMDEIIRKFRLLHTEFPTLQAREHAARIIVLLNEIGCPKDRLSTISSGVDDIWMPISRRCQPLNLEPGVFRRFQDKQHLVLADTFSIGERQHWPGIHMSLDDVAIDNELWKMPQTLSCERTLGGGGFGDVAQVRCPRGSVYALKRIERKATLNEAKEQMNYVKTEIAVLRRIRHCHFIKLVASYTDKRYIGILMHPVADCNLAQYLENFEPNTNTISLLAGFFGCLSTALAHLHYVWNIRHKDIKPQNILVKGNNVILTDFGMALDWSESQYSTTNQEKLRSPIYCAPEVAEGRERNSMSDIWSLGCVFLEMIAVLKGRPGGFVRDQLPKYGSPRYWDCPEGVENIILTLKDECSRWGNEPLDWIETMLRRNGKDRPTSMGLRGVILQAKGHGEQLYCSLCCKTETFFDPDEDDHEQRWSHDGSTTSYGGSKYNDLSSAAAGLSAIKRLGARVHDPTTGSWGDVEMMQNPRSSKNWISTEIVSRFHLQVHDAARPAVFAFGDQESRSTQSTKGVMVTWIEDTAKKTCEAEFMIAPQGVPFQLLVGKAFVI